TSAPSREQDIAPRSGGIGGSVLIWGEAPVSGRAKPARAGEAPVFGRAKAPLTAPGWPTAAAKGRSDAVRSIGSGGSRPYRAGSGTDPGHRRNRPGGRTPAAT